MRNLFFVIILFTTLLIMSCENTAKVDYDLSETTSLDAYYKIKQSRRLNVTKNNLGKIKMEFLFPEEYCMPIHSEICYITLSVNGLDYTNLFDYRTTSFNLPIEYEQGNTINISLRVSGRYNHHKFTDSFDGNIKLAYLYSDRSFTAPSYDNNNHMTSAFLRWNMSHNNNMQFAMISGEEKNMDGGGSNELFSSDLDTSNREFLFPSVTIPDQFGEYGFWLNYYLCSFNAYMSNKLYVYSGDTAYYHFVSEDSTK